MPNTLFPNADPSRRAALEKDPTLRLLNSFDWSANALGPISGWSESLRGAVRAMMVAATPMVMLVGEYGILIYNDAYARFAGNRHPGIFGMPTLMAWPEIADFNRGIIARGLAGESWELRDQELVLDRHGEPEPAWMDLHYSPLVGADGSSFGTLCIVHETTERIIAERALARSEERMSLAMSGSNLVGTWDWDVINNLVTSDERFASLYSIDPQHAGTGLPIESFLAAIHPDDVERVGTEINAALSNGSLFESEYRLLTEFGTIWVLASGRPRLDGTGRAVRFPGVVVNITEQKTVAEALAASELRFRTLADAMPQMVWSTLPDGYHDYYNARWYEFTGVPQGSTDGEGWNGMFHPDDQERAWALWRHSLATGEPYQLEYRLRHHSGEYRWTLGRALPIRDATGTIVRWIGTCTDIHESRLVAEERELVAQELSHRIKNIFAVLTGIISLSARNAPEAKPFADELRHRVFALSEAHDFVRPHSHISSSPAGQGKMSALIDRLMRAYTSDNTPRVTFSGDDIALDDAAATPLALLFHELATNAAKYGALSTDGGRIEISGANDGDHYRLSWREIGGPAIESAPTLGGFGSRLVHLSVEGQMRGTIERTWTRSGLELKVELPLDALKRSARLRASPSV